jgi:isoleucyl-tRNA synthetase
VQPRAEKGFIGLVDHGTQLLLDGRITKELAAEGMAREVIRHVQNARKEAGLEPEDRIVLRLETPDPDLAAAIETHWTYIAGETLATKRATEPIPGAFVVEVKVEGKPLRIELKKM